VLYHREDEVETGTCPKDILAWPPHAHASVAFQCHGRHARSDVGLPSLPSNVSVEVELIVEVE